MACRAACRRRYVGLTCVTNGHHGIGKKAKMKIEKSHKKKTICHDNGRRRSERMHGMMGCRKDLVVLSDIFYFCSSLPVYVCVSICPCAS